MFALRAYSNRLSSYHWFRQWRKSTEKCSVLFKYSLLSFDSFRLWTKDVYPSEKILSLDWSRKHTVQTKELFRLFSLLPPLSLSIALSLLLNRPFLYPEETLLMRGEALDFLPSILIESSLRVASHLRRDGKSWWRIVDSHTFSSESSQNKERLRDTWVSLSRLKEEKRLKCWRLWVACFSSANQFNPSVGCLYWNRNSLHHLETPHIHFFPWHEGQNIAEKLRLKSLERISAVGFIYLPMFLHLWKI